MSPAFAILIPAVLSMAQPLADPVLGAWCEEAAARGETHAARLCASWNSATGEDRKSWASAVATLMRRERMMTASEAGPEPAADLAPEPEPNAAPVPPPPPAVLPALPRTAIEEPPRQAEAAAASLELAAPPPKLQPVALPDTPLGRCLAEVPPGSWTSCGTSPIPLIENGIRGNTGPASVIIAWNGAAFAPETETMYFTGGGHTDYGGTEIYAFDAPRLAWRLERPHTGNLVVRETGSNGRCDFRHDDGTPSARHTYDGILYFEGKIAVAGGSFFCPHGPSRGDGSLYVWDIATGRFDYPMGDLAVGGGSRTKSGIDRAGRTLIFSDRRTMRTIRDWQVLDTRQGFDSGLGVGVFLSARRLFAIFDDRGLRLFPISRDGRIGAERRVLERREVEAFNDAGLAELADGNLAIWPGGRAVYVLDTASWTLSRHEGASSGPAPSDFNRVYSKFAYLPAHRALMGYNDPADPVRFFRLAADGTMPAATVARLAPGLACDDRIPGSACPDLGKLLATGGRVVVPAGVYLQCATIERPGDYDFSGALLRDKACGGKAALVVRADMTIRNLECSDIRVGDGNGACIRQESGSLVLENVHFHDSQQGVLTGNAVDGLTVRNSRFERLGGDCRRRCGQAHGIYYGAPTGTLEIVKSRFSAPRDEGHLVKSGAPRLILADSELDERGGKGSRSIDAFNGGELIVRDSRITALRGDGNWELVGYDRERRHAHARNRIEIVGSEIDCAGGPLAGGPMPDDIVETGNRYTACRDRPGR